MKEEFRLFLTAILFFTRIPCPGWVDHSPKYLIKAMRYFPLTGILVGVVGAVAYLISSYIFPHIISILICLISAIFLTGALHEDGLADVCDGFGGGFTKEQILHIMKDSRIGTFGVLGLISILALKFASLYSIPAQQFLMVFIAGQAVSRFASSILFYTHDYVTDINSSKTRLTGLRISQSSLLIGFIFCLIALILFLNYYVFLLLVPVFITGWFLGSFFEKKIDGLTGDCLGATQQICEVVFYLSFIVLWKFI